MALIGATAALELLGAKGARMRVLMVSDSEYLVKGMRLWAPGWEAEGGSAPAGPIENLQLWQDLVAAARRHDVQWTWVRGHAGHPKNEYVERPGGGRGPGAEDIRGSGRVRFLEWLAGKQAKKKFLAYDPDAEYESLERRLAAGEEFPLAG